MNTHKFRLISGPICEVKEFTGRQQEILTGSNKTKDKSKFNASRTDRLIASILVAVGSERLENFSEDKKMEFVKTLMAFDKKHIIIQARQFSMDFDPNFSFRYKWLDDLGNKQEETIDVLLPYDEEHFPTTSMKNYNEAGELEDVLCEEYYEVVEKSKVTITLPKSGEKVSYTMLDSIGENIIANVKAEDRHINKLLEARRPVKYIDGTPVSLNLRDLSFKDIEYLRKSIKDTEGDIDSIIMFEHPDAENRAGKDKTVELDIVSIEAFFFLSEAL